MNVLNLSLILVIIFFLFSFISLFDLSFAINDTEKYYDISDVSLHPNEIDGSNGENLSMNISTSSNDVDSWSNIYSDEMEVDENETYTITSHMGLNQFAIQSHISIDGFNQTSQSWDEISQCPFGIDGPLKMQRFVCNVEIEPNITKIRLVFNAGWSSENGQKAITNFGEFYIYKADNSKRMIFDNKLKIQQVVDLSIMDPIAMNFLGPDDILVADKTRGLIYEIKNGILTGPLLDANVTGKDEFGLNSIHTSNKTYVFVYYKESANEARGDDPEKEIKPKCNCLYRYELVNNKLINPELLFALLTDYIPSHHSGGVIRIGPDNNLYLITGDMAKENYMSVPNKARNFIDGPEPDGSSGVLRFTIDGKPVNGILGDTYPLSLYFAYGIRNSFGMDFDPVTGNLWDTENGPEYGDEINLVEPGFNSGHNKTEGIWEYINKSKIETINPTGLVDFEGKGKYRTPEFTWENTVGPVALAFFNSTKLGVDYNNTMFVSDTNNHYIYNFKLNENRTGLELVEQLEDKIANGTEELSSVIFASGLGTITDIKTGPDGFLYLLGLDKKKLFRIVPDES